MCNRTRFALESLSDLCKLGALSSWLPLGSRVWLVSLGSGAGMSPKRRIYLSLVFKTVNGCNIQVHVSALISDIIACSFSQDSTVILILTPYQMKT